MRENLRAVGVRVAAVLAVGVAASVLAPGGARADLTVVFRESDGHDQTHYTKGDRLRIQDFGDMGPEGAVLFDARTKHIVLLYDDSKSYFDFTKAMQKVRPQLARLVAMTAPLFARRPTVDVRHIPVRDQRTINGFACEVYDEFIDGRVAEESCFVPWTKEVGSKEEWDLLPTFCETIFFAIFNKHLSQVSARSTGDERPPGLAVWTQKIRPDRSRGEVHEIMSLKVEPIPAAIFSVPPDYHEVDQPLDPPRDGAERQRALKLARASPRGEAISTSATGFPISAGVALALVAMLTFGLFVHAFFLHLAAGWVVPESRFISALIATAIVWLVGIPLELLHVWPPAELVVGTLATYAGLKVGYRTSTARTIALLIVSTVIALVARFLLTGGLASLMARS